MKRISLIVSVLLLASFSVNAQKLNCKKFKNGNFKILKDAISPETIIERKGNVQIERISGETETTELIVDWIDDCTYTLTPKDLSLDKFVGLPNNAQMKVEILEIKKNSYIQMTTSNFADFEIVSEMFIIK